MKFTWTAQRRFVWWGLAAVLFLLAWGLLLLVSSALLDRQAVIVRLNTNAWLKLLNPDIRRLLVIYAWQPFVALLVVRLLAKWLDAPAGYLARRLFVSGCEFLTVDWDGPRHDDLPRAEFLLVWPSSSYACSIVLRNRGPKLQINRTEVEGRVQQRFPGRGMTLFHPDLGLKGGEGWTATGENRWVIDTPLHLPEGGDLFLPILSPDYDRSDDAAELRVRDLAGVAALEIAVDVTLHTEQGLVTKRLLAPLWIILEWEEQGDSGIDAIVRSASVADESEREALWATYQNVRWADYTDRRHIATQLDGFVKSRDLDQTDHAVRLRPNDASAHLARGRALAELQRFEEALASFDRAAELGLTATELNLDYAKVFTELSRTDEALAALEPLLSARPDDPWVWAIRGKAVAQKGCHEDALAAYDRAVGLDPSLELAQLERGHALADLDRVDEALAAFDRAAELFPKSPKAFLWRALVLHDQNRDDEALAALEEAVKRGYDNLDILGLFKTMLDHDGHEPVRELIEAYGLGERAPSVELS